MTYELAKIKTATIQRLSLFDFKLSPCSVCCSFLLGNSLASEFYMPTFRNTYQPMRMEQTECSEMSAYKIRMPGNYPKENIQQIKSYLEHKVLFWTCVSKCRDKVPNIPSLNKIWINFCHLKEPQKIKAIPLQAWRHHNCSFQTVRNNRQIITTRDMQ